MLAVDSGAAEEFARLSDLPDAAKIWREEYLPAYAQKYGVRVGDVNAVVRSGDALDAARVRKMIDSIPDEEESLKLEAIGDADIEQLSDAHLEYAAERGQTWAADELVRRAEAENAAGIDSDDVFSRLDFEGAKLPTPEAMAQKGGSLSEEMKAVYDSLPAALKKKYFIDANVKLDEVAESLGYETEAELISALSDAAGRVADGYAVPRRAGILKPKQKGRKFLQDSVPANWEQYETELPPSGYSQSKSISESQDRNLKPRASIDVSRLPDLSHEEYANIIDRDSKDSPFGFVVYNGRDHYGEISDDTARKLGIPAGKIYLQNGRHDDSTDRGFGRVHIFKKHYSQFAQRGFETVEAFVENVFDNVTDIFKQGGVNKITLFVKNDNMVSRLDLRREIGGYSIQTAHMDRAERIQKKETLLWEDGEVSSSAAKLADPLGRMSITASKDYDKRTMGHGRVSDIRPSENVSESQEKILKSFEKRDFKGVETDGFVPAAQVSIEKSLADDAANAAKWVAMTPEERVAEACPDFTDKAIELSRAMARKNAGHPLPTYGGLKLELVALKSGKFKIVEDGKKLKPIKVFRDETQAREFLDKWILAYADASRITYYVPADVRGVFADAGGLSAENAYVRDAKGEIKVDGIVMRKAKPERLVRDVFVTNWDKEYDSVKDEKAELERLNKRDFDSVDEFKRWLEKNSAEVEKKFGSIRMEYRFDEENLGKPAAEEEAEIARRQQFWLENNVEDLARLYKARIREEEFDFEDEVDDGDGLDWEDGGDDGFGAPAELGGGNVIKAHSAVREKIRSIFDYFKTLQKGKDIAIDYMPVSERTAKKIFEISNREADVRGAKHVLTSSFIPHIERRHHFEGNKFSDSLPITEKDLENIPDVVENWDDITFRRKKAADTITYKKAYPDGTVMYVEELWDSNKSKKGKRLASKTIYKRKGFSVRIDAAETTPGTSETYSSGKTFQLSQSENVSESQGKNSADDANASFASSGGGRMESSTNPYPPDLTMPKDGRFDPKRVDSSARKDYDASAAQKAFDEVWDTLGDVIAFLSGSRDKSGANHIILKHYGENARMGYVSADEILQIGEIIRSGNLEIVNENERRYWVADPNYDGRRLTVVVKKSFKKKQPDFVLTFYSNKKAEEVRAKKQASGATHSVLSSSTMPKQSENLSESQGKKSGENGNNQFGSSGGGRMESSTNPYPPDLTMPKDGRFDPKRVDSSPRKDYDASAAQEAFDNVGDTLGDVIAFLSGSRDKSGDNYIMLKHYGENARMGYVSADEILQISEIICSGNLEIVGDNERRYWIAEPNYEGRRLTVVVEKSFKKKQPDFVFTFYSNKKAEEVRAQKQASGQPHSVLSSSTVPSPSENVSESQGKNLRSFEKRDFKGVETDGFVPAAQVSIEKSLADDAANAAKWVAMTPEERVAEACPDFTDKAIELSKAMARKNAGHPLPTYGGLNCGVPQIRAASKRSKVTWLMLLLIGFFDSRLKWFVSLPWGRRRLLGGS